MRRLLATFQHYRALSKSGIVTLVLISVIGGYLIGQPQERPLDWARFGLTLLGVLFLASGSSALNQIQERAVDAQMPRTAGRPLPSGQLSLRHAAVFSLATLGLGIALLARLGPTLLAMGLLAAFSYNGLYTLWWKRHWAYAAVPGAVPGALPILMGYAAASGQALAPAGLYLFLLLFFWQMPHFWVLALRFREDYAQGSFPTLPVSRGEVVTVLQITLWGLAYLGIALMAPLFLRVGVVYLVAAVPTSLFIAWELRRFARERGAARAGDLAPSAGVTRTWLRFFLGVNFSLVIYLGVAALDVWSYPLLTPLFTR